MIDPSCGLGWHDHPDGSRVWGVYGGDGCAWCDAAEAWLLEQLRDVPPVATIDLVAIKLGHAALRSAVGRARSKRAGGNQGDLF